MKRNRLIMGAAIGLATIAAAIDHTRFHVPAPVGEMGEAEVYGSDDSPCSMDTSPCAMDNMESAADSD
jgi:hypothetical protein